MFELQAKSKTAVDIMMYGTISEWSRVNASDFTRALKDAEDAGYTQANLRIHSPGGSIFEGLVMIAQMKASSLTITAYIDGMAASMASVIAINADKVLMAKGSRLMIHQGSGVAFGSAKNIKNYGNLLDSLNQTLAEFYAEKTGKESQWILDNWMSEGNDEWFNYKKAKKEGLVDGESDLNIDAPKEKAHANLMEMAAHYETQLQTEDTMKEQLIAKYGLKADATDAEIMAAIDADKSKATETPSEMATADSVDAFMAMGKKAGLVTDKNEANVKTMVEKAGMKATAEFLAGIETPKPAGDDGSRLSELIDAMAKGNAGGSKDKTFDDMTAEEREALYAKDPAKFDALYATSSLGKVKIAEG